MISRGRRPDTGAALISVAFLLLYTIFIARGTFRHDGRLVGTLFDDALISLRYADHLATGQGLVWNRDERPRVEGYSNLGWTLVMTPVVLVSSKRIAPIVVSAIGAAILIGCGLAARRTLRIVGASVGLQRAGLALVLAYFPLVFWTLRGMEVGLLALLLLWAVALALDDGESDRTNVAGTWLLSLVAGAAFLVRNDSIVPTGVVLLFALCWRGIRSHALAAVVPVGVCILAQVAFRYSYYGELVPNTYTLKLTGVPLSTRLSTGFNFFMQALAPSAWLAALASAVVLASAARRQVRRILALGLTVAIAQSLYLIRIGGDAWGIEQSNRFLASVLPVLIVGVIAAAPDLWRLFDCKPAVLVFVALNIVFVETLFLVPLVDPNSKWIMLAGWTLGIATAVAAGATRSAAPPRRDRLAAIGAIVATLLILSGNGWMRWIPENAPYVDLDRHFARVGLALGERLPADVTIAAAWVGAPAYFSGLRAVDLYGKADKHVAHLPGRLPFRAGHNKIDLAYSIGILRPDVVLADDFNIPPFGYIRLPNGIFVRADSALTADARLARAW
jgi:arabinofuranosyltransferase